MFILSTYLTKLSTCGLVVGGTVVAKDNREEKTREVADIRLNTISIYHVEGRKAHTSATPVTNTWQRN